MTQDHPNKEKPSPLRDPGIASILGSTKLLYWLLPSLIVFSVVGTLIPQGEAREAYLQRYGAWAGLVMGLRLDYIYHSAVFVFLQALLGLNLGLCTWRRRPIWGRRPDVLTTHAGVLVILAGGLVTAVTGQRGSMPLTVGQVSDHVDSGARSFHLPFSVKLDDFTVERYGSDRHSFAVTSTAEGWTEEVEAVPGESAALKGGAVTLKVLDYYPDFVMQGDKAGTRSQSPNNPAVRVEISDGQGPQEQWAFAKFEGFHASPKNRYRLAYRVAEGRIKQFRSDVEILEGGWVAARSSLSVNTPFRRKGWTLYQSGYDPENPDYSILMVSRDPGIPVVYAGFLLLCAGVTWTFVRRRPA